MRTHLALTDEPVSFHFLYLPFHLHNTKRVILPHWPESYSISDYNRISPPSQLWLIQYCECADILHCHSLDHDISRRDSNWSGSSLDLLTVIVDCFPFIHSRLPTHLKSTEYRMNCTVRTSVYSICAWPNLRECSTICPSSAPCWYLCILKKTAVPPFEITFFI